MQGENICYIMIGLLLILNLVVIIIAVKNTQKVDDYADLLNEDGLHIYYDRKLIAYKKKQNGNNQI